MITAFDRLNQYNEKVVTSETSRLSLAATFAFLNDVGNADLKFANVYAFYSYCEMGC